MSRSGTGCSRPPKSPRSGQRARTISALRQCIIVTHDACFGETLHYTSLGAYFEFTVTFPGGSRYASGDVVLVGAAGAVGLAIGISDAHAPHPKRSPSGKMSLTHLAPTVALSNDVRRNEHRRDYL